MFRTPPVASNNSGGTISAGLRSTPKIASRFSRPYLAHRSALVLILSLPQSRPHKGNCRHGPGRRGPRILIPFPVATVDMWFEALKLLDTVSKMGGLMAFLKLLFSGEQLLFKNGSQRGQGIIAVSRRSRCPV
jgi:hypothetical protein